MKEIKKTAGKRRIFPSHHTNHNARYFALYMLTQSTHIRWHKRGVRSAYINAIVNRSTRYHVHGFGGRWSGLVRKERCRFRASAVLTVTLYDRIVRDRANARRPRDRATVPFVRHVQYPCLYAGGARPPSAVRVRCWQHYLRFVGGCGVGR